MTIVKTAGLMLASAFLTMILIVVIKKLTVGKNIPVVSAVAENV